MSEPGVVSEAFRRLLERAAAENRLGLVVRAARYMMDELAYDPGRLGESRDRLPTMELDNRVGFVRPLQVEYAIHEPTRQVFIRRVTLLD